MIILKILDRNDEFLLKYVAKAINNNEFMWKMCFNYLIIGFPIAATFLSIISVLVLRMNNEHFDYADIFRPAKLT